MSCDRAGTGLLRGPGLTTDHQGSGWNQHEQQNMEALDIAFDIALGMRIPFLCAGEPPKIDEDPCVSGTKCSVEEVMLDYLGSFQCCLFAWCFSVFFG